jgi:hypothetical protein
MAVVGQLAIYEKAAASGIIPNINVAVCSDLNVATYE